MLMIAGNIVCYRIALLIFSVLKDIKKYSSFILHDKNLLSIFLK